MVSILLVFLGTVLGAMFAGTETAYYRTPRLRLQLDAMRGDRTAKFLLGFANYPSFFIATVLVGNNAANYLVSLSVVLFVGALFVGSKGVFIEIGTTLMLAPFLFVFGEMFPKYISLLAPTKVLRRLSPLIFVSFVLFLPITIFLWGLNKLSAFLFGRSSTYYRFTVGRQELVRGFDEGRETGLLFDVQRRFTDTLFEQSNRTISEMTFWPPLSERLSADMPVSEALTMIRQSAYSELPVFETGEVDGIPIGSVRRIDLEIAHRGLAGGVAPEIKILLQTELPVRSIIEIGEHQTPLSAMIMLQTMRRTLGCVIGRNRRCIWFVSTGQLKDLFLHNKNL